MRDASCYGTCGEFLIWLEGCLSDRSPETVQCEHGCCSGCILYFPDRTFAPLTPAATVRDSIEEFGRTSTTSLNAVRGASCPMPGVILQKRSWLESKRPPSDGCHMAASITSQSRVRRGGWATQIDR